MRIVIAAAMVAGLAGSASAQTIEQDNGGKSATIATAIWAASASADWVQTHRALSLGAHEDNPLINSLQSRPAAMIAAGAAMDAGSLYLWNTTRKRPTLRKVGLYAAAAFRVFLAVRNQRVIHNQRLINAASH